MHPYRHPKNEPTRVAGRRAWGGRRAFTLVEVVLAIGIAIGVMVVALYFYHQASQLRAQLIEQSEQISETRLLMERITLDLRVAHAQPLLTFQGSNAFLRFAMLNVPAVGAGLSDSNAPGSRRATDLSVVAYEVGSVLQGTNRLVTGIHRTERPFQVFGGSATPPLALSTNLAGSEGVLETHHRLGRPITERVRYLSFGFWDGVGWKDRWASTRLPQAVRLTMGWKPLANGATEGDYGGELFRRVVVLPGYGVTPEAENDLLGTRNLEEGGLDEPDEGLFLPTQ